MSNVVSWIPKQNNRIVMYEVVGEGDRSEFGSENANEAIAWLSRNPLGKRRRYHKDAQFIRAEVEVARAKEGA